MGTARERPRIKRREEKRKDEKGGMGAECLGCGSDGRVEVWGGMRGGVTAVRGN